MGERLGLIDPDVMALCWVVDFPLLEVIEENGKQRYHATHNPFSGMQPGEEPMLDTDPLKVTARQYDIICNGYEIGGGSIRINVPDLQRKVFELLGLSTTSRSPSSSATSWRPSSTARHPTAASRWASTAW